MLIIAYRRIRLSLVGLASSQIAEGRIAVRGGGLLKGLRGGERGNVGNFGPGLRRICRRSGNGARKLKRSVTGRFCKRCTDWSLVWAL